MISLAVLSVALSVILWNVLQRRKSQGLPLPPGPPRYPIVGNLFNVPSHCLPLWRVYDNLAKQYESDLVYLNMAGTPMIIANSYETVTELFEHRSSLYSTKPAIAPMLDLMGWSFDFALMPYGPEWKAHRKMMHHSFHEQASKRFRPQQLQASRVLLKRLIDSPENVLQHIRLMLAQIMLTSTYGLEVDSADHKYVKMAERAIEGFKDVFEPGKYLIDLFPWLKYVPSWIPGAGFKRKAEAWRKDTLGWLEIPLKDGQKLMDSGLAKPSFISERLSDMGKDASFEQSGFTEYELIKNVAGLIYGAATDTSVATLGTFVLAMGVNPDVQRKAQAEVDRVLKGELPTFEDENALPYVTALLMETLRFHPALPVLLHYVEVEDTYKGFRIPAGTSILTNSWAQLHDETDFPQPFKFNPERFLKDGQINPAVRDPRQIAFGAGRRICPGRHFAMAMVWITISSILATFDISDPIDENGVPIKPGCEEFTPSLLSEPKAFKCSFKLRSEKSRQLIEAAMLEE